jgi:hypothetical protein
MDTAAQVRRVSDAVADRVREHVTREVQTALVELGMAADGRHDRLLTGIRRLDEARSLSEVLDRLVEATKAEAGRVALFTLAGQSLQSWRVDGFQPVEAVSMTDAGVLAEVLRDGQARVERASGDILIPLAASVPAQHLRHTLLAPIRVGERSVALLCAERHDEQADDGHLHWPAAIEILARHAARTLEALTALRTAQLFSRSRLIVPPAGGLQQGVGPA